MSISRLGALVHIDPDRARSEILAAAKAAGSIPGAAEALSLHHATLYRLVARLGLRADLEAAGVSVGGDYPPARTAGLRNVVRETAKRRSR